MNSKPTFERKVSVDRAEVAAQRLTNSHFQNPPYARVSIPRNQDDDDIVIFDFIAQAAAQLAEKEREIERLKSLVMSLRPSTLEARAEAAEERLKEAQAARDALKELLTDMELEHSAELRQREAELEQARELITKGMELVKIVREEIHGSGAPLFPWERDAATLLALPSPPKVQP